MAANSFILLLPPLISYTPTTRSLGLGTELMGSSVMTLFDAVCSLQPFQKSYTIPMRWAFVCGGGEVG